MTTAKQTITSILFGLFDELSLDSTVGMARELAVSAGLNATSAEIAFYRWRAARGFYVKSARPMAR